MCTKIFNKKWTVEICWWTRLSFSHLSHLNDFTKCFDCYPRSVFELHTHTSRTGPLGLVHPGANLLSRSNFTSLEEATAVNITPNWFQTPELRVLGRFSNFPFGSLNLQLVSLRNVHCLSLAAAFFGICVCVWGRGVWRVEKVIWVSYKECWWGGYIEYGIWKHSSNTLIY